MQIALNSLGVEAGPADQRAVDVVLGQDLGGVGAP